MKPEGHQTITQQAADNLGYPFYLRHWLPNELPGTAVQADRYLFWDSYAHFMRDNESIGSKEAVEKSIAWVKTLGGFACQQIFELRRNFKIPPGNPGSWAPCGFTGHESRNTNMAVPAAGFAPWAVAGAQSPLGPSGAASTPRLLALMDTIRGRDPLYGKDTFKISFSIGFALHAMQDSYTARHAERRESYAGAICRLYEYVMVRDATLIGLFPELPTIGAKCNNEPVMSHYQSDLLANWTAPQYQRALVASQQLILLIMRAGDTAVNFGDLKTQFDKSWTKYQEIYLRVNLEGDTPTKIFVTKASEAALDPENYSVAGGRREY